LNQPEAPWKLHLVLALFPLHYCLSIRWQFVVEIPFGASERDHFDDDYRFRPCSVFKVDH
jgi:hypothetical protein